MKEKMQTVNIQGMKELLSAYIGTPKIRSVLTIVLRNEDNYAIVNPFFYECTSFTPYRMITGDPIVNTTSFVYVNVPKFADRDAEIAYMKESADFAQKYNKPVIWLVNKQYKLPRLFYKYSDVYSLQYTVEEWLEMGEGREPFRSFIRRYGDEVLNDQYPPNHWRRVMAYPFMQDDLVQQLCTYLLCDRQSRLVQLFLEYQGRNKDSEE